VEQDRWAPAEGLRDLALFLLRRAPVTAVLWTLPLALAISPLTALPNCGVLTILFTVTLGMVAGAPLGQGLDRATGLSGWGPGLAAFVTAALVLAGGTAIAHAWKPLSSALAATLVWPLGLVGASAAIAWFVVHEL